MAKTSKRTSASPRRSPARRRPSLVPADPLVAFAGLAKRERLRWYLFGAQAVAVYGVQRASADLDITIDLGDRTLDDLAEPFARAGFAARFADRAFAAATRVFPVVHTASSWPIDLVLAGPGLEQEFLARARGHTVARTRISVLSPEDLIVTKLLAQRPKDLEDVRGLVRKVATLDHAQIVKTLARLEAALDRSDLRPLYAKLRKP